MSYYYDYFLGYRAKNGMFYPLGPFDHNGKIHPVVSRSYSSGTSLYRDFSTIASANISDELKKAWQKSFYDDPKDADGQACGFKWLFPDELPDEDFIERGYFLIEEVRVFEQDFEKEGYYINPEDYFSQSLTPMIYAAKLEAELAAGKTVQPDTKDDGYHEPSASEYMYYAYPNTSCNEYDAYRLRTAVAAFASYGTIPEGSQIVIIESEG